MAALNWALPVTGISGTDKCVLLVLANRADDAGLCYPGVTYIARQSCMSERSVRNCVRHLTDAGLISIVYRGGDGSGRKTNLYQLPLKQPAKIADRVNRQSVQGLTANDDRLTANCSPNTTVHTEGKTTTTKDLLEMSVKILLKDGSYYTPERKDILRWRSTYPTIDLCEHLKLCAEWNEVNPGKRKTLRGVRKHISTWLSNVGKAPPWQTDDVDPNAGRHVLLT